MASEESTKSIIAALSANLAIAIAKFVAWLLSSSSSMLAEAIHSVADTGNQLVLLIGRRRSKRKADTEHPFGYGGERFVSAFLVAIILFSAGGLFALYEAYEKFHDPHGITGPWWWVPLAVIVFAIIAEGLSLRTAIKQSARARGRRGLLSFVRSTKNPELPVVLLEDTAALLGLTFALLGVGLTILTGDGRFDAAGTAAIGVLLVVIAVILAVETRSLLLGESASKAHVQAIRGAVANADTELVHLRTMHVGPEELLIALKIVVAPDATGEQIADHIDRLEKDIRAAVPLRSLIYIEPDIKRRALPADPESAGLQSPEQPGPTPGQPGTA